VELGAQSDASLAEALVLLGWHYIRAGRLEKAQDVLEWSRVAFDRLATPPAQGFGTHPLPVLGLLAYMRGDYAAAAQLGAEARRYLEARGDLANLAMALYVLASAAFAQGRYEAAAEHAQQAYAIAEQHKNRRFTVYVLNQLGDLARVQGDYAHARRYYEQGYAIRESMADRPGIAAALDRLGAIALVQREYASAHSLFQQSRAIYQEIEDRCGLAASLNGLGAVACALGDLDTARTHLHDALQLASAAQLVPLTLSILSNIAELYLRTGREAQAIELLKRLRRHPSSDRELRDRAAALLARVDGHPASSQSVAGDDGKDSTDLGTVISDLLQQLIGRGDA
jgi:tetratricopeptide (TPR) repeat protein